MQNVKSASVYESKRICYVNVCQCLIFLNDTQAMAHILDKLMREGEVSLNECKNCLCVRIQKNLLCLPLPASVLSSLMTPRHWWTSQIKLMRVGEVSLKVECKKVYLCVNLEEPVLSASVLSSLMTPRHWPTSQIS